MSALVPQQKTAQEIYNELRRVDWRKNPGKIMFSMANTEVVINTTDTVGITLQSWLKQFFIQNNIYFREPNNTQSFPDFYLLPQNNQGLLEIKAFRYSQGPAFDIANFYSYCDSIKEHPYRLYADYIILGYEMDVNGLIFIQDIWIHKIWEIAGTSKDRPLKVQAKRNQIYNIRPNSEFKNNRRGPFVSVAEFIYAIYGTIAIDKDIIEAKDWLCTLKNSYKNHYNTDLEI